MVVVMNEKCLIFAVLLGMMYQSARSQNQCNYTMPNLVAYKGNEIAFPRLNNNDTVIWLVDPYSEGFVPLKDITDINGTVVSEFNTTYAVNGSQLTIFNATVDPQGDMLYSTAGLYSAQYLTENCKTSAALVVIADGPTCSCDGTNPNNVTLSCSVSYSIDSDDPSYPTMTWFNNAGVQEQEDVDTPVSLMHHLSKSTSELVVGINDAIGYRCQIKFSAPSQIDTYNVNQQPPGFSSSCNISNCTINTTMTTSTPSITTEASTPSITTETSTPSVTKETPNKYCAITTTVTKSTSSVTTTTTTTTTTPYKCTKSESPPKKCENQISNMVVYAGNATAFDRQDRNKTVKWTVAPSSEIFKTVQCFNPMHQITDNNGNVVAEFNTTYAVNASELTILNATVAPQGDLLYSTAGLYILDYQHCQTSANLVVIENGPVCACEQVDGTNVKLSCSVNYASSSFQPMYPIMTWKNRTGDKVQQDKPEPSLINQYVQTSTSVYSVTTNNAGKFECLLSFSAPSMYPVLTVNTMKPNFTRSCFYAARLQEVSDDEGNSDKSVTCLKIG